MIRGRTFVLALLLSGLGLAGPASASAPAGTDAPVESSDASSKPDLSVLSRSLMQEPAPKGWKPSRVSGLEPMLGAPGKKDIANLFAVISLMRRRLSISEETAFYIGRRHMKVMTYHSSLYDLALEWVRGYRLAVARLLELPVSRIGNQPHRLVQLREAVAWGRQHAIAEPWYFKQGYRRMRIVLP